jgi:signal transduction histidine kinase
MANFVSLRRNSLSLRLLRSAALWIVFALAAAAIILTSLYRSTVENAFDERLGVYLKSLIAAVASQRSDELADPGNLGEQRFERLYSGWYWQIRRVADGQVLLWSDSLFTDELTFADPNGPRDEEGNQTTAMTGPEGESLRVIRSVVSIEGALPGSAREYEFLVAGNASELAGDIAAFRNSVIFTLAALGVGLILAMLFQVRWGLRPLDKIRSGLSDLRSGKRQRFDGPFPAEIEPLAKELNALLDSNQEIVKRARTQVGNLAHGLKTPLSVITNEARAGKGPFAEKVAEQAELMKQQITHYLDRARIAAGVEVIGAVTEVEPVVGRLTRAMQRIHGDRALAISTDVPPAARFKGEQQDFEEIVGNLIDNACKWAKNRVSLSVAYADAKGDEPARLALRVEDDGPGLTPEQMKEATRRGKRLDETKPGSGLGLSIVCELVGLYGGHFNLSRSSMGGLAAAVDLPGA